MRDIKFRAWDSNVKKMIYQNEMSLAIYFEKISLRNMQSTLGNEIELMQYTGLKDKNGKEIYEGDVVRYYLPSKQSFVDDIKWVRITTQEELNLESYGFQFEELPKEVIGNIYENPELLKND